MTHTHAHTLGVTELKYRILRGVHSMVRFAHDRQSSRVADGWSNIHSNSFSSAGWIHGPRFLSNAVHSSIPCVCFVHEKSEKSNNNSNSEMMC